jgi:hypothetical protein
MRVENCSADEKLFKFFETCLIRWTGCQAQSVASEEIEGAQEWRTAGA